VALALPAALTAQTGQFVVRLGTDTLAIEQYTRTQDRLQGEQVLRSPRTVHRLYSATFGSGGDIARFELVTHNVSGAPGPAETKGTLLGLSGVGGTMQVTVERTQSLDFAAVGKAFAPRSLGVLSPPDSVKANVAGAALAVRYSRPSTRGRAIFGNVVPWNQVWRTGANQATIFEASADLVIAGTPVPGGKCSLWTLPSPAGWKLIVNKNTGQWGTDYKAQYDVARLDMTVEQLRQP